MTETQGGAARRARIERALGAYPHIPTNDLADLLDWYRNEASAYDIAMLACDESIADGYRRFRRERIDAIGWRDALRALAFAGLFIAAIAAMMVHSS